jgi:hypothetical protein
MEKKRKKRETIRVVSHVQGFGKFGIQKIAHAREVLCQQRPPVVLPAVILEPKDGIIRGFDIEIRVR